MRSLSDRDNPGDVRMIAPRRTGNISQINYSKKGGWVKYTLTSDKDASVINALIKQNLNRMPDKRHLKK